LISLVEVAERAMNGPRVADMEWNMGLFKKSEELKAKYKISEPGTGELFCYDEELADRAFDAGVELLSSLGLYCVSNGRVVELSRDEVIDSIRALPEEINIGEGIDARRFSKREIEDLNPPRIVGGLHGPVPEHLVRIIPKCFAEIPQSDMMEGFNMITIDGRRVHGVPIAAYTARREASLLREAVRAAGRPGMAVALYPIHTDAAAMIAPLDPEQGLRRTDGALFSILPDLKIELNYLTAAIVYEEYGAFKENRGGGGTFFTSVGGCVIGGIASSIASWIAYRDRMISCGAGRPGISEPGVSASHRRISDRVWPSSLVHMSLSRNSNMIRMGGSGHGNPGTLSTLIDVAFQTIVSTVLGANINVDRVIFRTDPAVELGGTPVETELTFSVSDAVVGSRMRREELEPILRRLEERHRGIDRTTEKTYPQFLDLYNPGKHRPQVEYQKKLVAFKRELQDIGINVE
jgi:methylamine--corrinoid protein Co-methyltransferase